MSLPLFFFFLFLIAQPFRSFGQSLDLSELTPDLRTELISNFPSLSTEEPNAEDVDKSLRYLMGKGLFEKLTIVEGEKSQILKTTPLKTINELKFEGLESFTSIDLLPILQIEKGQKYDPRILFETRDRIKSYYTDQGYLNTIVDVSSTENSNGQIDLIFKVYESKPIRITGISIDCQNPELLEKLKRSVRRYSREIYQPQIINEINKTISDYLADHRYLRANLSGPEIRIDQEKTKAQLFYHLERTERYRLEFSGNDHIPGPRLVSALELTTFKNATPQILPELIMKLKEYYWRRGFARVEITGEERVTEPNVSSTLNFKIQEGLPVKINEIQFTGSLSQAPGYYEKLLIKMSGDTIQRGYFHRMEFETGVQNLLGELQNSGYLKAKLISARYLYSKDKSHIAIGVNIDEGPLTRIDEIRFSGLKALTESEMLQALGLKMGEPLRLEKLELSLKELKNHFQEKGYLEFRILNEKEDLVSYSKDNTSAHIIFSIDEGPQVRVASILIDGNLITKEIVFKQELEFKVGDILTPSKIEESTFRLQKLSLFNSVEIKTLENKTQIADRTVIVKVSERSPGLFNLGAGFTNERLLTVRGFAGLAYRNLNGIGRGFSTRAELNYTVSDLKFPEIKLTTGYLEPYLWESRTKGRVNFTRAIQVTDYESRTGTDSYQIDFSIERQWGRHLLFTYDVWNISQLRDFLIVPGESFSRFGVTQSLMTLASTGPAIEIDYRDHPFNPTTGTITRFQFEYSNPLLGNSKNVNYLKSTGSFTHYWPFWAPNPVVLANSLRVGDLTNLDPNGSGVPYDKKGFVLGGISTIRGFEAGTSERFPNDSDLGLGIGETYQLKKSSQFFLIKSELRFPLFGSLGGAVFYDGGLVAVDHIHFNDPYRDAAGFGLRYATPVGPANIEFAWKLDTHKERNESPFRLHISIGTF